MSLAVHACSVRQLLSLFDWAGALDRHTKSCTQASTGLRGWTLLQVMSSFRVVELVVKSGALYYSLLSYPPYSNTCNGHTITLHQPA